MKKLTLFTLLVSVLAAFGATTAMAGAKLKVCHIPPGNPENFHTITISDKALNAHLTHGDLVGGCYANAEALCDDGNACTVDGMDAETETCRVDKPTVNCDDGSLCTTDTCDPESGCMSARVVCDDGDACTVDACSEFTGFCEAAPIDCGPLGACLSETGSCDYPCAGITCEPIDQCHEAGACVLPGDCEPGRPVVDGTTCNDGDEGTTDDICTDGVCAGDDDAQCPCWTGPELADMNCNHEPTATEYGFAFYTDDIHTDPDVAEAYYQDNLNPPRGFCSYYLYDEPYYNNHEDITPAQFLSCLSLAELSGCLDVDHEYPD
jgi:hypothetical protein